MLVTVSRGACVTSVTFVVSCPTSSSVIVSHVPTMRRYVCVIVCVYSDGFLHPSSEMPVIVHLKQNHLHLLHMFQLCLAFSKRECMQFGTGNICGVLHSSTIWRKNREIQGCKMFLSAIVPAMEGKSTLPINELNY